ncbi:AI-2E family transporter [Ideonella sp.]|uniref:AI-2E family transporter n=1 Tax=Ideonella sp. TaxID=1929293 RepID=UPI002B47530B|nr:AI-2E family transporter [Ideonella sp.]HJV70753.1 AI-2E family transporter [Ideonella sp.]
MTGDPAAGAPARVQRVLAGLFVVALVLLLKEASALLVPVAAALVLTFVFAPVVRLLRGWGLPETVGAGLVVAALLAVGALGASTLVEPATEWWDRAPSTLAQVMARVDRLRLTMPPAIAPASAPATRPRPSPRRVAPEVTEAPASAPAPAAGADPIKEQLATEGVALTRAFVGRFLAFCLSAAATVFLLYFLLASEHWVVQRSVQAIPRWRTRALVLGGLRSVQREISHFLGALAVVNLGVGIAMGLAAWGLGLPNPVLWGTVAGVLNFIPYLGPMISATLLLMAGILTFDTLPAMLAPPAALLAIHGIESNFISPFFVGARLSLSPVSMCLSVMLWGWLWGMAGAVMAVPMLVALRALCRRHRRLRLLSAYLEGAASPARWWAGGDRAASLPGGGSRRRSRRSPPASSAAPRARGPAKR